MILVQTVSATHVLVQAQGLADLPPRPCPGRLLAPGIVPPPGATRAVPAQMQDLAAVLATVGATHSRGEYAMYPRLGHALPVRRRRHGVEVCGGVPLSRQDQADAREGSHGYRSCMR